MGHDTSKCVMGAPQVSGWVATDHAGAPATYLAGLAVRQGESALSLLKTAGSWIGVSLGKSLSSHDKTSILRTGRRVPMLIERQPARGIVTITSYANLVSGTDDALAIGATSFVAQAGAATPGDATFQAATGNNETAASLAAQINAHATAGALVRATAVAAVVTLTAINNSTAADTIGLVYTDNDTNIGLTVSAATLTDSDDTADWLVLGAKAYISDTTGKVDDPNSNATVSDAVIASALITGIQEDGTEAYAVLVDMPGGL